MKVQNPINIRAKSQVDRSTHNENIGEGSNEQPPPHLEAICLAKRFEAWRINIHDKLKDYKCYCHYCRFFDPSTNQRARLGPHDQNRPIRKEITRDITIHVADVRRNMKCYTETENGFKLRLHISPNPAVGPKPPQAHESGFSSAEAVAISMKIKAWQTLWYSANYFVTLLDVDDLIWCF